MFTDNPKKMYLNYKLVNSMGYVRIMILVMGVISALLLIPDIQYIQDVNAKTITIILRILSILFLAVLFFLLKRIKTFFAFSLIVTAFEMLFIFVFLFVMHQYRSPDFFIQTLGLMTLIIAIFLIPNNWINMLIVSVLGSVAYFVFSAFFAEKVDPVQFTAAICYVILDIGLCTLFAYISDRHQNREFLARRELQRLSSIDQLTEAANRYKLGEEVRKWGSFCERNHMPICIALIDVDNLKRINDQHGHLSGDSILIDMVRIINGQLRRSDVLARWGGDEFVILLPNATRDNAVTMLERIRKSIEEHEFENGLKITCSFGVVEMEKDVSSFEEAIKKADRLMYMGKKTGKNTIQFDE